MTIKPPSSEGLERVVWLLHKKPLNAPDSEFKLYKGALPSTSPGEAYDKAKAFNNGDRRFEYIPVLYTPVNPRGEMDVEDMFI